MTLTTRTRAPSLARVELDTGLTVVAVRKPRSPLVEVRLRVPFAGTTRLHSARAEMLVATMLLGHRAARDREQVDADLALVGGHLDASVDPQRLMITGSVLSTGLPVLLEVLADCLTDAAYRRADVLGERERLVEHLAISATQPSTVAHRFLQQRRFGDHPAAWDMPDAELVAGVGPAALRGLHTRAVVPRGSTLVLVGDLSPTKAIAAVADALAGWTGGPDVRARTLRTPPAIVGDDLLAHHRDGAVQSQIRLSAAAVAADRSRLPGASAGEPGLRRLLLLPAGREHPGGQGLHLQRAVLAGVLAGQRRGDCRLRHHHGRRPRRRCWRPDTSSAGSAWCRRPPTRSSPRGTTPSAPWRPRCPPSPGLASTLSMLAGSGLDETWLRDHPARLAAVDVDDVAAAAASMLAPARFTGVVVGDLGGARAGAAGLGNVSFA